MSRKVKLLLIVFLSLPELFGLGAWAVGSYQERANEQITKQNLHVLQLQIERYAAEDPWSAYPFDLPALESRHYSPELPNNPYSARPMQALLPSDTPVAGDFSYLTDRQEMVPGLRIAPHYILVAYGRRKLSKRIKPLGSGITGEDQIDWSRVICALENGIGYPGPERFRDEKAEAILKDRAANKAPVPATDPAGTSQ